MADENPRSVTFGAELRRLRLEAGMSLTDLARVVNYSKPHLSKIETGAKKPTPAMARRCDELLNAQGVLALLAVPQPARTAGPDADGLGEEWAMRLPANGGSEFHAFGELTAGLPTPSLAWAVSLSPGRAAGRPHDAAAALSTFQALLHHLRGLGQRVDPALITAMLMAATSSLRAMAADATAQDRDRALRLAARFAEYTGWLAQEKDDEKAAAWWTRYAVKTAAAGGEDDFAFYGNIRLAEIELYRENSLGVVRLARAALDGSKRTHIRSLASQREAQGHAVAGDAAACERALDHARTLLLSGSREVEDEPALGSTLMPDPLAFVTAWCMQDLGRSERAIEILTEQLQHTPEHALRVRARYGARLALALADTGEIERACETITPVLATVFVIDSATVRSDLRRLGRTLRRSRNHEAVRRIQPDLALALR